MNADERGFNSEPHLTPRPLSKREGGKSLVKTQRTPRTATVKASTDYMEGGFRGTDCRALTRPLSHPDG